MLTNEQHPHPHPSDWLLSPLPGEQQRTQRTQGRTIPTEELHSQLLLWLLHHPFQRSEDLLLALQTSSASLYRVVKAAEEQGEIESVQQTAHWYYLSNHGVLAAAAQERADVKGLARSWEADERGLLGLLPRVQQLAQLQAVINGLVQHAPRLLAYPDGTLAEIEWTWRRTLSLRFLTHVHARSCQVDAALCFSRSAAPVHHQDARQAGRFLTFLVLLDRPTDDEATIRERLVSLLQYRESRRTFYSAFPTLLVLTETVRRRDRWHRHMDEARRKLHLQTPLSGAITHLPSRMPSSTWSLPWQRLGEQRSCRLQDLLIPLPLEAVPPGLLIPRVEMGRAHPQKRRVLVGGFQQRAQALDMEQETNEELLSLLGGVLLRPRYLALLHLLYRAPLLSAAEMIDLSEEADLTRPTMLRYLQQLQQWRCIRREDSPGGVRWLLSKRGVQALARITHADPRPLMEPEEDRQKGIMLLMMYREHTAGVYRCLARFGRAAHQQKGHHLVWWESGRQCEHHYHHRGQWQHFRPDALCVYQIETTSSAAWLEYDRGTESREALAIKFQTYQTSLETHQWKRELLPHVPRLLIVVPDPGRRHLMREVIQETMEPGMIRIRVTTMPQLQNVGPHAAIWQPVQPGVAPDRRFGAFEEK